MENLYERVETRPIRHLFHDCGYIYISNIEPKEAEPVTVRLRAEKGNVTWAYVEFSHDGGNWISCEMSKEKEDETGYFEYFIGTIPGQSAMFKYRFRVGNENQDNEVYYSRTKIGREAPVFNESNKMEPDDCWVIVPGLHTPDWAKGILWYSIMPDAFYNGDITNDESISGYTQSNPWNMAQHTLRHKYGGDLRGIKKKLDYIKELGCEAVFMDPIFKSTQNAGYGPEFYKQIEHSFGNKETLVELANAVHERGMYYMIDVVLTFVALRHIWYNADGTNPHPGAAQEWDSPYHDFFYFTGEEGDTKSYVSDWGGLSLNFGSKKLCDLIYKEKDSYLQYYCSAPFSPDAVRFDCGGAISGKNPDGTKIENHKIMGDIRSYLRDINPELMLLSEYSFYPEIDAGVWDSRWNLEFVKYGLKYMRGEVAESFLFDRYDKEIRNVPRTFALCQYNSMADHDRPRVRGVEDYALRAFQMIHMTQLGSPCIYYGDENRIDRGNSSFYAMEWNEANWDYAVRNDTKALTELRKRYSTLRTGIIQYLCVDDEKHILAYARKDHASTIVTIASRNPAQREFAVNARELGETDGTVFTDWFTGKSYTVKDGYFDVELPAGGTVLVKGTESSSYKGGFVIAPETLAASYVTMPKERTIRIEDSNAFVYKDVFNACEISAVCKCAEGTGVLAICEKDVEQPAFIGAAVSGDVLTVYARTSANDEVQKVITRKIEANSYIKIVRNWNNMIDVYATKVPGSEWIENICTVHINLPNHALVGMAVAEGSAEFGDINVKHEKEPILWDDFRQGHTAMFDFTPDMNIQFHEEGIQLCPEHEDICLLTNAPDEDWTMQAELQFVGENEGDYAGIISKQDEDIYVVAGRRKLADKQIFFIGRASAGTLDIYHTMEDVKPNLRARIQLQRIGTTYSAIVSYDGSDWLPIGKNIIANLCAERAGLVVSGNTNALFGYVSFGDAIHDGISTNTPHTPGAVKADFEGMKDVVIEPAYRIVSGQWEYANEGYVQTSKSRAQMGIHNKVYTGFKVDGTYAIDEGCGFVGFEFGKQAYDSPLGDGILIRMDSEGRLAVVKEGRVIADIMLPLKENKEGFECRIAVENRHGMLLVCAGQNGEPILTISDFKEVKGYIAYFSEGVIAHVNNSHAASYDAGYNYCAYYEQLDFSEHAVTKSWAHTRCFLNHQGVAMTDFVTSARFEIKKVAGSNQEAFAGFYLCSPEGKFDKAISVVFNRENKLFVKDGTKIIANAELKEHECDTELMIVKRQERIAVYVNGETEPLIDYRGITKNGGAVSLCANKEAVVFKDFALQELTKEQQLEETSVYKAWMRRSEG